MTLDAHKWLYLPKACGVLLVRNRDDLIQAFAHEEAYIPHERTGHMVDITLEYSRPFRALKLWLAFRAHGAEAFRVAVEENLRQARLLYELVLEHDQLEPLCGPPPLSIVPFRHLGPASDPNAANALLVRTLQDDARVWVAPATVDGKVGLGRASSTSAPRTTTFERSSTSQSSSEAVEGGATLARWTRSTLTTAQGLMSRRACARCSTRSRI